MKLCKVRRNAPITRLMSALCEVGVSLQEKFGESINEAYVRQCLEALPEDHRSELSRNLGETQARRVKIQVDLLTRLNNIALKIEELESGTGKAKTAQKAVLAVLKEQHSRLECLVLCDNPHMSEAELSSFSQESNLRQVQVTTAMAHKSAIMTHLDISSYKVVLHLRNCAASVRTVQLQHESLYLNSKESDVRAQQSLNNLMQVETDYVDAQLTVLSYIKKMRRQIAELTILVRELYMGLDLKNSKEFMENSRDELLQRLDMLTAEANADVYFESDKEGSKKLAVFRNARWVRRELELRVKSVNCI